MNRSHSLLSYYTNLHDELAYFDRRHVPLQQQEVFPLFAVGRWHPWLLLLPEIHMMSAAISILCDFCFRFLSVHARAYTIAKLIRQII